MSGRAGTARFPPDFVMMRARLCIIRLTFVIAALCLAALLFMVSCDPLSETDYFTQADAFYDQGRYLEAVAVLEKYLKDYPRGAERSRALFRLGEIRYYALRDRGAAITTFSRLIRTDPNGQYTYRAREIVAGVFKNELGDYRNAVREYEWLAERRPEDPKADWFRSQVAQCFLSAGHYEQAILEYGRLLEKSPDTYLEPRVYDELAAAYLCLGRSEEALYILDRFLEKFPGHPLQNLVLLKKGSALEDLYRYDEALEVYQGLLETYKNRRAVEIRIAALESRKEDELGEAKDVDYNYRPEADQDTMKNFDEDTRK